MRATIRGKILESARKFFFTKGYNKTSIQNIIDDVEIAKGTFYHHFKSKEQLLDEISDIIVEQKVAKIQRDLENSTDDAFTKFNTFVNQQTDWKLEQLDLLYVVLTAMYSEHNILFQQKIKEKNIVRYLPILTDIIKQGISEGIFDTDVPELMAELILRLSIFWGDGIAEIFLRSSNYQDPVRLIVERYNLLLQAIERLLDAKKSLLGLVDRSVIEEIIKYIREREEEG